METSVEGQLVVRGYSTRGGREPHVRLACMLVAAAAVASCASFLDPMRARYYETAPGQHRTINCSNSSITLNTQSRIAIQCSRSLLRVRLLRGEASFRTSQDPSRSALVLAGDAQVYEVRSIFSVRLSDDRTTVRVIEGFVQLSVVDPGQRGSPPRAGSRNVAQQPRRTLDEMPVWAGESGTVVNTGSELVLESRRIGYSPAARGVTG